MYLRRKKNIGKLLALLFTVVFMVLLNGCGSKEQVQGVSFQEDTVTIEKYETYSLKLFGVEDEDIEWKSKDKTIATVENGVVCGRKQGNTEIFAYIGKREVSCNVVVTDNQYIPVIELHEPDELILDKEGTYQLQPVLAYNGNTYTDAEYTYSSEADSITVDEKGVITAGDVGDGFICVKANWRGCVVETSLAVNVIDASTSIEVSDKVYNIYLNGTGGEYPAKADLGISIFDKDISIEEKNASVKYVEKPLENDVEGAATIKNGVVYAAKYGTTHFVAEYTSIAGEVVRSTTFTINVLQTPADKYMAPIEGEEFEFFIEPLSPENSVEWDDDLQAFHLINKVSEGSDNRGFLFDKEYIADVMKYTNADYIKFEVRTDGISSGLNTEDRTIYIGSYPDWFNQADMQRYALSDEWTEIEIVLKDIPLDSEGNLEAIFLLNTVEGMYIRNIRFEQKDNRPIPKLRFDITATVNDDGATEELKLLFFNHAFEGRVDDAEQGVERMIAANGTTTVELNLEDFLVNGELPGFGFGVLSGPEWNAPEGKKTTLKIENVQTIVGTNVTNIDLSTATWKSGVDTGIIASNNFGKASYKDGAATIRNIVRYDAHEVTFGEQNSASSGVKGKVVRFTITGTSSNAETCPTTTLRIYNSATTGQLGEIEAYKAYTLESGVKETLDVEYDFLANAAGEIEGFTFATFDYADTSCTYSFVIEEIAVVDDGKVIKKFDISATGMTWLVGAADQTGIDGNTCTGNATFADGTCTISECTCWTVHKFLFNKTEESDTPEGKVVRFTITGTSSNAETSPRARLRIYNSATTGSLGEIEDYKVFTLQSGLKQTLNVEYDFLANASGEIEGFTFATFDYEAGDEYSFVIEEIAVVEGDELIKTYDISETGMTWLVGGIDQTGIDGNSCTGTAAFADGVCTVSGCTRWTAHKFLFNTAEVPEEKAVRFTITGTSSNAEISPRATLRIYNSATTGQLGAIEDYKSFTLFSGVKQTLDVEYDFLANAAGEIEGFTFATFDYEAGVEYSFAIEEIAIVEGDEVIQTYDISETGMTWLVGGIDQTGIDGNSCTGTATFTDGVCTVSGCTRWTAHKFLFNTAETPDEPKEKVVRFTITGTHSGGATVPVTIINSSATGALGNLYSEPFQLESGKTQELDVAYESLANADGEIEGFSFVTWNYSGTFAYVIEQIAILEGDEIVKTFEISDDAMDFLVGAADVTGIDGSSCTGTAAFADGKCTVSNCSQYSLHKFLFNTVEAPKEKVVRFTITGTHSGGATVPVTIINSSATGALGNLYSEPFQLESGKTQELDVAYESLANADGEIEGFSFVTWNYSGTFAYVIEQIAILEGDEIVKTFEISDDAMDFLVGAADVTGIDGSSCTGTAAFADGKCTVSNCSQYSLHKFLFNTVEAPKEKVVRFTITGTHSGGATVPVTIINSSATGALGNLYSEPFQLESGKTQELDVAYESLANADGEIEGFSFVTWNYSGTFAYVIEQIAILEGDEIVKTFEISDDAMDFLVGAVDVTGIDGSSCTGTAAFADGKCTVSNCSQYSLHKFMFNTVEAPKEKVIRFTVTGTNSMGATVPVTIINSSATGALGDLYSEPFQLESGKTQELDIAYDSLANADGEIEGFGFVTWNYSGTFAYVIEQIAILEGDEIVKTFEISDDAITFLMGGADVTGIDGSSCTGTAAFADGKCTVSNCSQYSLHKFLFNTAEAVTTGVESIAAEVNWFSTMLFRVRRFITDILV